MTDFEEKVNARKRLMMSAKTAQRAKISRSQWENAQVVKDFALQAGLHHDIVHHIASWVWTFERR